MAFFPLFEDVCEIPQVDETNSGMELGHLAVDPHPIELLRAIMPEVPIVMDPIVQFPPGGDDGPSLHRVEKLGGM